MAWIKVPPEHHPIFVDALPKDPRIERIKMFGGVAAKVNGHIFAGLFGRSTMVQLPEPDRAEALALEGAGLFDPMGDGRMRSTKVMLPESMMGDEEELRAWLSRAFRAALAMPPKEAKPPKANTAAAKKVVETKKPATAKKPPAKKPPSKAAKRAAPAKAAKRAAPAKPRAAARTAPKRRARR
jgi:TfoX/Sxy family transcriptional regulator of competence genes